MTLSIKPKFLQKYIQKHILEVIEMRYNYFNNYYEVTVTFNPQYWTLTNALYSIPEVVADIIKPIIRANCLNQFQIAYCVEYHDNGYPHLHAQILNSIEIHPEDQRNIHQRLCRRYGKSQWYQTGLEDKIHVNDKFPEGIKWSEYIKKDIIRNQENGQRHYFQYQFGF